MQMHTDAQILMQDVSFTYDESASPALSHISAKIRQGEFVAVLGHNGSGKSTLAKLINALYIPGEGNVVVCGYDTKNEKLALDKYKYEKEEKIRIFIDELEKNSTDEFQKRRILKLKNDFNDILDEDDDSHNIKESEGE